MLSAILLVLTAEVEIQPDKATANAEPVGTVKFDILVKQPEVKCDAQSDEEIIVCAAQTDNEQHRLRPIENAAKFEKDESKAEFSIAENAKTAVEADTAGLPGGVQSNRLMVRLKLGF